jgi:flavin reductase (DIM6/NTAB) family NADH-FMN oxidoreductase RutF
MDTASRYCWTADPNQEDEMEASRFSRTARPEELSRRERYRLLTSLVIPRPIGWISTVSAEGVANLAPYSFFNALSASPPLVGVSIGFRGGEPKDTLRNIRETSAFAVNICSEELLEAMNISSGEFDPMVDEFEVAGLTAEAGETTAAPVVGEAPAVLECEFLKEVELGEAHNVLVIGEVKVFRLSRDLDLDPDTGSVDPRSLRAVGRLGADQYAFLRDVIELPRPR